MNNNNKKNTQSDAPKIVRVQKKSIVPVILVVIVWALALLPVPRLGLPKICITTVVSVVVYFVARAKFPPKIVEIIQAEDKKPVNEFVKSGDKALDDFIEQGFGYVTEIKLLNDAIKDDDISDCLDIIEHTMYKIFDKLKTDPDKAKRIVKLNQFMNYYIPTTIKILDTYRKREGDSHSGSNIRETKKRIAESMPFIRDAFISEYDSMFREEMVDITTDIVVMENMLSQEGLIDRNNIDIKKFENGNKEN